MEKETKDINFKYNFNIYWSILKKYKPLFFGILLLTLFMSASLTLSKFLFKEVIDKGTEFAAGDLAKNQFIDILIWIAIIFGTIRIFRALGKWFNIHMINQLDSKLIFDLKKKLFNHIIHLSHNFHTTNKTGSLISRLMRGGSAIERMTDVIVFNAAPLIFQMILVSSALLLFSWVPALISFLTILIFISYSYFIQQKQRKANVYANKVEDIEKGKLSDYFTNIDSIKYFGKENDVKRRFSKLADNSREALVKHWNYFRVLDAGHAIILGLGTFLLMLFPLLDFLNGKISIGTIVFIYTVYGDLMGPLFSFVHGMRNFYRSMADFESLFQYYKVENEIKEKPGAEKLKVRKGTIEFRNVFFGYIKKRKLLRDFNLDIKKNQKVAFVGHSGSGKSTLVKLLYRLYDVEKGAIFIDNKNIRNVKQESLRSELSIVPQECVLFDDTIYNNIKFSNPKATKKEVMKAIKFAQLDKIIETFSQKEKTIVGERGVRLSGGEKQRVSIARAILANKKILVLDEATSALDSETEHEIQKDLEKLMVGRTSIIIAHRLSTIMKADKIVVLKNGKIIQSGYHNQLIKQPGEYKKLWNLQKGGYIK